MYKKVLVPLDGSEVAEHILPHVKAIAAGCGVQQIVLFRVLEPTHAEMAAAYAQSSHAGVEMLAQWEQESQAEAETYMSQVTEELARDGLQVKLAFARGNAAEEILKYAEENGVDLIMMSTHGRSGIARWALGSVTDRVLNHSIAPVLVVSPPGWR